MLSVIRTRSRKKKVCSSIPFRVFLAALLFVIYLLVEASEPEFKSRSVKTTVRYVASTYTYVKYYFRVLYVESTLGSI